MNQATAIAKAAVRICSGCDEQIPDARLKVVPNAKQCVGCLEKSGDVPLTRRYDEHTSQGTVSTLYTNRQRIKTHLKQNDIAEAERFLGRFTDGVVPREAVNVAKLCDRAAVERDDSDLDI